LLEQKDKLLHRKCAGFEQIPIDPKRISAFRLHTIF